MSRRLRRSPRGSLGVEIATYAFTAINGLPAPFFSVAPTAGAFGLSQVAAFESNVHARTNVVTWFQNPYNSWPSGATAIAGSGRYQVMTFQPATASLSLAGGIRTSDGTVDNPMVAGTSYSGVVLGATPTVASGPSNQPAGTYLCLGGLASGPMCTITAAFSKTAAAGTQIACSAFTVSKNYTSAACADLSGMINGTYDSLIAQWARYAANDNLAVRFGHEMNASSYPWATGVNAPGFTASQFVSLWNHVRSVWRNTEDTNGLPHVPWIWCPNISVNLSGLVSDSGVLSGGAHTGSQFPIYPPPSPGAAGTGNSCYPGDSACEFIGLDGYSYPNAGQGANPSFSKLFDADLAFVGTQVSTTKPLLISETGVDASYGSANRASWFRAMGTYLATQPRVQGFDYFDHGVNSGGTGYQIDGDAAACQGLKTALDQWTGQ